MYAYLAKVPCQHFCLENIIMKIAYLINWEISSNDGVSKKVYAQAHEWQALNNEVKIFCIAKEPCPEFGSVSIQVIKKEASKNILQEFANVYKAYNEAFPLLADFNPDIIYFRFDIYQPALLKIFKAFPSVIEMNSNDSQELRLLAKKSIKGKIRSFYHQLVRNKYLSAVDGFCCVTNEIADLPSIRKFKKPVFVVPNAIQTESCHQPSALNKSKGALPNLVFMGTPNQSWHGIDKIINLARATQGKLVFNIIGIQPDRLQDYPSNINFHGYLQKHEYEKIVSSADIGVCTLALHRKKMEEASPLKTREYLAYGLPIIIGYRDTAFLNSELPDWVLQLQNTENNVEANIDKILEFCIKHTGKKLLNGEAKKYIDSHVFEKIRLQHMGNILQSKGF
jgi:hypothetical protein